MTLSQQSARHFREVFFGGNWTCSNFKDQLSDVTWELARKQVDGLNSIATLTVHINYYVDVVLRVLKGGKLQGKDEESFDHSFIQSEVDWQAYLHKSWSNAEEFARHLETLPDSAFWELMAEEKQGILFRNIHGIVEHTHYHLGQIALIKKLLANEK